MTGGHWPLQMNDSIGRKGESLISMTLDLQLPDYNECLSKILAT